MSKVSPVSTGIKVIALDLEGTLIASASNPVARPGLYSYLEWCKARFQSVVIYTCIDESRFRSVADHLAKNNLVPVWFKKIPYVEWDGIIKDLYNIESIEPKQALIVDDAEIFISESQKKQWIPIKPFEAPYHEEDTELSRVIHIIENKYFLRRI